MISRKKEQETIPNLPLFFQFWWLDLVSGANRYEVLFCKKNNFVEGAFAFAIKKRGLLKQLGMPPLTPYLGLWFNYPKNLTKNSSRLSFEQRITQNLISKLPKYHHLSLNFSSAVKNWYPLYLKDFDQTTRYTYRIKDSKNLWDNLDGKIRTEIRKIEGNYCLRKGEVPEKLYDAYAATIFSKGGILWEMKKETFLAVIDESKKRGVGEFWEVIDSSEKVVVGALILLDRKVAYYVAGATYSREGRGGMTFMLWNLLQYYTSKGIAFDFEGSMIPNVESFFRGFGGEQLPYFQISKSLIGLKILQILRKG